MSLTSLFGERHGPTFDDDGDVDDVMALSLSLSLSPLSLLSLSPLSLLSLSLSAVEWSCETEHYPGVRITS